DFNAGNIAKQLLNQFEGFSPLITNEIVSRRQFMTSSQIVTPKVTLTHRDCLFIELIDDKGNAYFGECNAFQTD
ncbi:hypothetical protein LB338_14515, partial [Staphylococcus aureus]|nr:hypothetical protein [Staphylococcus aureus]